MTLGTTLEVYAPPFSFHCYTSTMFETDPSYSVIGFYPVKYIICAVL